MQYVVQQGDTLQAIAQKFGTTVDAIARANNISDPNVIYAGQVIIIPTGTVPPSPPPSSICPELKRGDRGPAVSRLQTLLKNNGFDPGTIDGIFGPKTESAVKYFQRYKGLSVTGVVDVRTWTALGENCGVMPPVPKPPGYECYCPVLRLGNVGPTVRLLQKKLKDEGLYNGRVDGDFGGRTLRAVKQFQRREGLTVTGVVDQATWRALGVCCHYEPRPPVGTPIATKVGKGIRHILYTDKAIYNRREDVHITLSKTNITDDEINLRYPTNQIIEIVVENRAGQEVWRYSNGKNFAQGQRLIVIYPGGTQVIKEKWNQKDNNGNQVPRGTYTITETNLATDVSVSVDIEIR